MKSTLKINDIYEGKIVNDYADYKKEMTTSINNPAIIHYVSKPKPWDAMCDHPLEQEYYKYLSLTQFKNYNPPSLFHIFIINPSKLYLWVKEIMKKLIRGNPYLPIIPN
jgi:lipopolysaccharide biosynthesis glycosyltransferase